MPVDKEEIISRLSAEDIYGGNLKKSTKGFVMLCPFHDEDTPSFHIFSKDKSFRCFGCGEHGSAFTLIMKQQGVEFQEALRILADRAGVRLDGPKVNATLARLFEINAAALDFYRMNLQKSEKAMRYLEATRGLTKESIERFKLGCTNGASLTPYLKERGFTEDEILDAGFAVKKEGGLRDFFFRRFMFPVIRRGKVYGFSGRRVSEDAGPKYLNSKETAVFHKSELLYGLDGFSIKEAGFAIIVEGNVDVITCHQYGYKNAVAPLGTALTGQQITLLRGYTEEVVLLYDGDHAGQIAAERSAKLLFDSGMKGRVAVLPQEEDPDSYLRKGNRLDGLLSAGLPFGVFLSQKFPMSRNMIFHALLRRDLMEAREFVSYIGTSEETKLYSIFEAADMIEEIAKISPLILRKKDVEVRQYQNFLVLLSKGKFRFKQRVASADKQALIQTAEEMHASIQPIRRRSRLTGSQPKEAAAK